MTYDLNKAQTILGDKELFVFDMDGTIYLGSRIFPEAREFILRLRENGRRVLFFTNNASRSDCVYYERLGKLGFDVRPGEVMTSADVTAAYLNDNMPGQSVYAIGTRELLRTLREKGIKLICDDDGNVGDFDGVPDIVLSSFDIELTYKKIYLGCNYIANGAQFFSTHPDLNCPEDVGFLPDSGAICAMITASTGVSPVYFGKPAAVCAEMISSATGVGKEHIVMLGDRLYTDIATARRAGMTALLVMTGETTSEMLAEDLPADQTPDIVAPDMAWVEKAIFGEA